MGRGGKERKERGDDTFVDLLLGKEINAIEFKTPRTIFTLLA